MKFTDQEKHFLLYFLTEHPISRRAAKDKTGGEQQDDKNG
jgi:hypothetical protein